MNLNVGNCINNDCKSWKGESRLNNVEKDFWSLEMIRHERRNNSYNWEIFEIWIIR